jgi:hypothetical protein
MVLETTGIVDLMVLGTFAHAGKKVMGKSYHRAKKRSKKHSVEHLRRL